MSKKSRADGADRDDLVPQSLKWPTPEQRRSVFEHLCEHLRDGLSLRSWPLGSTRTIDYYLERFPEDWPREAFEMAWRQGKQAWEAIGKAGIAGAGDRFAQAAWIFTMRHRYGWRDDVQSPQDAAIERTGDDADKSGPSAAVIVVPGVMNQDEWQASVRKMLAGRKERDQ